MNQDPYLQLNLPRFEFIDAQLNSVPTFNPRIVSNQQYLCKPLRNQTCSSINTSELDPILHAGIKIEPPDPLDLSEIKIEPNTFDYISEIKIEEDDIKQEAYDVGDHSYASVSKVEHSYAKIHEEDLKSIEESAKAQKNKTTSLSNETVANKENSVIVMDLEFEEGQEIKSDCVEIELPQDVDEEHKRQTDLEAHLREIYLNDGNIPAGNDLKPLESVPVTDLLSDRTAVLNCRLCGFTTNKILTMENHMLRYARKKSYKCYQCEFVTWYSHELVLHKRSHLDTVQCNVCKEEMSRQAYETHRKIHWVKCNKCDFIAADDRALNIHMMNVHTIKTFRCATCNYVTSNYKQLRLHMETHFGEKPYKCTKCGYSSLTSSHLRIHMRTHAINVPYKCNKCSYTTSFSCDLLAHMDTHTEHLLKNVKSYTKRSSITARPKELELVKIRKDEKYFH